MNQSVFSCCDEPMTDTQSTKQPTDHPYLYSVYLQNGNDMPLDFITDIIRIFFFHSHEKTKEILLGDQTKEGKIICGIYTKDIAETKVHQVNRYLKKFKCELQCGMEPV